MNIENEIEKIKQKIDRHEIISFDLYDTLIFRQVEKPSDIFELTIHEYLKKNGGNKSELKREAADFVRARSAAELSLYKSEKTFDLYDIYDKLNGFTDEQRQHLAEIEIRLEIELSFAGRVGKELYEHAVQKNKKIIVTTDMYLPETVISKILNKCGYTRIDKIYVSSQIGKWKSRFGELFQYVAEDAINTVAENRKSGTNDASDKNAPDKNALEDDSPEDNKKYIQCIGKRRILHIGDNYRNDVLFAKLKGIDSVFLENNKEMSVFGQAWIENTLNCSGDHGHSNFDTGNPVDSTDCYRMGYDIFGPLTLGYISWIHDISVRQGKEKILFFAREGYTLKKIYDSMYEDIPSEYVYVSRKALKYPLLSRLNTIDEIFDAFYVNKVTTYEKLLGNLNLLGNEEALQILRSNNIELTSVVSSDSHDKELLNALIPIIHNRAEEQYDNVCKYLDKVFRDKARKLALVDIGWTGSMQNAFETLVKEHFGNVDITGFFLVQMIEIKKYLEKGMKNLAYLCGYEAEEKEIQVKSGNVKKSGKAAEDVNALKDSRPGKSLEDLNNTENADILRTATSILESVYSAEHGSTAGYDANGEPIFEEEKLSDKTRAIIHWIQQGMFDYCSKYALMQKKISFINRRYLSRRAVELFGNPSRKMLEIAKDIEIYDGKFSRLLTKVSPMKPIQFASGFKNAVWMNGYLKYNLKCRNSYPVYKFIRKIMVRKKK